MYSKDMYQFILCKVLLATCMFSFEKIYKFHVEKHFNNISHNIEQNNLYIILNIQSLKVKNETNRQ